MELIRMPRKQKRKIWIEIHQICGDCGRRLKEVFDLEKISEKELVKLVKLYRPKYNMACKRCSMKEK